MKTTLPFNSCNVYRHAAGAAFSEQCFKVELFRYPSGIEAIKLANSRGR